MSQVTQVLKTLPAGKTWGISPGIATKNKIPFYLCVRRTAHGFQIEAAWQDNAYDVAAAADDIRQELIGWGRPSCRDVQTAEEAETLYVSAKAALAAATLPHIALGVAAPPARQYEM